MTLRPHIQSHRRNAGLATDVSSSHIGHDLRKRYPRVGTLGLGLFLLLTVSMWLEVGLRLPWLGAIRFEFIVAALATVTAVMASSVRPEPIYSSSPILGWMIVVIVLMSLNIPFAFNQSLAWNSYVDHVLKYAVIGCLVPAFVLSPGALRAYLLSTLVAFMKIGQEAFLGRLTGSMYWENQGVLRLFGTPGTMFGHPNSLSGKTLSILPFAWYIYPTLTARWSKGLLLIEAVFALNIIVFTASRTGYLTFLIGIILIILLSNSGKGRPLFFAALLILAAVLFLPQQYKERFASAFTGVEKEGRSADTRKALFFDSLNTFADHPFGIGPECFAAYQGAAGRNAQATHNLYTQILAETGIQGMIGFLGLVTVTLRTASGDRRRLRSLVDRLSHSLQRAPPEQRRAAEAELMDNRFLLGTVSAVIVFVLVRLCLGVFGHDLFELYWWLAAGLTIALHNMLPIAEARCSELTGESPPPRELKSGRLARPRRV